MFPFLYGINADLSVILGKHHFPIQKDLHSLPFYQEILLDFHEAIINNAVTNVKSYLNTTACRTYTGFPCCGNPAYKKRQPLFDLSLFYGGDGEHIVINRHVVFDVPQLK